MRKFEFLYFILQVRSTYSMIRRLAKLSTGSKAGWLFGRRAVACAGGPELRDVRGRRTSCMRETEAKVHHRPGVSLTDLTAGSESVSQSR